MSMTREENICQSCAHSKVCKFNDGESSEYCNQHLALTALRPVSREQVEKMKKAPVEGEDDELYAPTYKCPECGFWSTGRGNFCRICGCLHTDEAVEMVMERLEALHEDNGCP